MIENLQDVISEDAKVTGWLPFVKGFEVCLVYIGRDELKGLTRKATDTVYVRHQPTEQLNDEKLARLIAPYIRDWKGLTGKVLKEMFPVKPGSVKDGEQIPCTEDNKVFLLLKAYGFDDFVMNGMTELSRLKSAKQELELKNSKALSLPA